MRKKKKKKTLPQHSVNPPSPLTPRTARHTEGHIYITTKPHIIHSPARNTWTELHLDLRCPAGRRSRRRGRGPPAPGAPELGDQRHGRPAPGGCRPSPLQQLLARSHIAAACRYAADAAARSPLGRARGTVNKVTCGSRVI